jgi:hypothetical protein
MFDGWQLRIALTSGYLRVHGLWRRSHSQEKSLYNRANRGPPVIGTVKQLLCIVVLVTVPSFKINSTPGQIEGDDCRDLRAVRNNIGVFRKPAGRNLPDAPVRMHLTAI